jgi:hypothetical protein
MHAISLEIVPNKLWFGNSVAIMIDGEPLIQMVRDFEYPMAVREGTPNLAGQYIGMPADHRERILNCFMGTQITGNYRSKKHDLLWCGHCGESGCWPLLAQIIVELHKVTWTAFEQPHRRQKDTRISWAYDEFGPFVFERKSYESQVFKVANEITSRLRVPGEGSHSRGNP